MIYFDHAATSYPKPQGVIEAVSHGLTHFGNPSRGAYPLALDANRAIVEARLVVAGFFGADQPERVIFTKNVTEALNLAINSVKGHIVSTQGEHNSVLRPLHHRGNITLVPVDERGCVSLSALEGAIEKDTAAIVLAHGSNVTGNVVDLKAIGALCQRHRLLFIVDAAQTAGLLPIDVKECFIDALCFTGHKSLYGPQGTGGMVLSLAFTPSPLITGGTGSHSFEVNQPTMLPDLLEAGTLNGPGILGLLAGVNYVIDEDPQKLLTKANELAMTFYQGLKSLGGFTFYGDYTAPVRMPIVTINFKALSSDEVANFLEEEFHIALRSGIHCAPLLHKAFGTTKQGAARFSFSAGNSQKEVALALDGLKAFARHFE